MQLKEYTCSFSIDTSAYSEEEAKAVFMEALGCMDLNVLEESIVVEQK